MAFTHTHQNKQKKETKDRQTVKHADSLKLLGITEEERKKQDRRGGRRKLIQKHRDERKEKPDGEHSHEKMMT